jgi:hypothetical protein
VQKQFLWFCVFYAGIRRALILMPHTTRIGSRRKYMFCWDVKQLVHSEWWMVCHDLCPQSFDHSVNFSFVALLHWWPVSVHQNIHNAFHSVVRISLYMTWTHNGVVLRRGLRLLQWHHSVPCEAQTGIIWQMDYLVYDLFIYLEFMWFEGNK